MTVFPPVLIALFFWFVSGFAMAATPPGQGSPRSEGPPALAPHPGRRITLDVVVTDHEGKPVRGLQQQDFTLLDNKKLQTILFFREAVGTGAAPDPSSQAIVVVDPVNNRFNRVSFQRVELEKFLRQAVGPLPLPMSVVLLSDTYASSTAVTREGNTLADSLQANPIGLRTIFTWQGSSGGADRTKVTLHALEQLVASEVDQPGRKLIIWLGRGWPLLENSNFKLSKKDQEACFQDIVWLSTKMREARITLDTIDQLGMDVGFGRSFYYKAFLGGVSSADKVQLNDLALQVFAVHSGGQVLNQSNDIGVALASCLEDAKNSYTLTFDSPPAGHADEYHSLQVKINQPRLTVRTRTGYYAQP